MMIRSSIPAAILFLSAGCHTTAPRPPASILVDPAIVEFESESINPTPTAQHGLEQFIMGYRNREPAFSGVVMCVKDGEEGLPKQRATYVTTRLAEARIAPVTQAEPDYCAHLGGYENGLILLLTRPR